MSKRAIPFTLSLLIALSLAIMPVQAGGFTPTIQALGWSPDGQALAYATKDGLFVVDLDGNQQRIGDFDPLNLTPAWSADGQSLLSVLEVDNQEQIYRFPLSGAAGTPLTEDVGWRPGYFAPGGIDPVTSPDGQLIAFRALREGDNYLSLYVMAADGSDQRRLTILGDVGRLVWSPDSQSLAFVTRKQGALSDLYTIDREGNHLQQITDTGDVDSYERPSWSPDGGQIVFCTVPDQRERIEQVGSDGSERHVIWDYGREPQLSPDGQKLLFEALDLKWGDLTIMDVSDSSTTTIQLPGEHAYWDASWSPDGTQIAFATRHFDDPKSEDIVVTEANGTQPRVLVSLKMK